MGVIGRAPVGTPLHMGAIFTAGVDRASGVRASGVQVVCEVLIGSVHARSIRTIYSHDLFARHVQTRCSREQFARAVRASCLFAAPIPSHVSHPTSSISQCEIGDGICETHICHLQHAISHPPSPISAHACMYRMRAGCVRGECVCQHGLLSSSVSVHTAYWCRCAAGSDCCLLSSLVLYSHCQHSGIIKTIAPCIIEGMGT